MDNSDLRKEAEERAKQLFKRKNSIECYIDGFLDGYSRHQIYEDSNIELK